MVIRVLELLSLRNESMSIWKKKIRPILKPSHSVGKSVATISKLDVNRVL